MFHVVDATVVTAYWERWSGECNQTELSLFDWIQEDGLFMAVRALDWE